MHDDVEASRGERGLSAEQSLDGQRVREVDEDVDGHGAIGLSVVA